MTLSSKRQESYRRALAMNNEGIRLLAQNNAPEACRLLEHSQKLMSQAFGGGSSSSSSNTSATEEMADNRSTLFSAEAKDNESGHSSSPTTLFPCHVLELSPSSLTPVALQQAISSSSSSWVALRFPEFGHDEHVTASVVLHTVCLYANQGLAYYMAKNNHSNAQSCWANALEMLEDLLEEESYWHIEGDDRLALRFVAAVVKHHSSRLRAAADDRTTTTRTEDNDDLSTNNHEWSESFHEPWNEQHAVIAMPQPKNHDRHCDSPEDLVESSSHDRVLAAAAA